MHTASMHTQMGRPMPNSTNTQKKSCSIAHCQDMMEPVKSMEIIQQ